MNKFIPSLCLFSCLAVGYVKGTGQADLLHREIGELIRYEAEIDFNVVPGVVVGVLDADSMYVFSFGKGINQEGIFELGSVTKPVVAWLADQALDSLGWSHNVSVCRFLPDSLCSEGWEALTITHIIQHRAGLLRWPPGIGEYEIAVQDPYAGYDIAYFAKDMKSMKPLPEKYSYSHVGYSALHWLFEKVGGLESFTRLKLCAPLDLRHTGWEIPDEQIATGHGLDGRPQPPWHTNALAPSMGLKSSVMDLLRFLEYISPALKQRMPELTPFLKKELKALRKTDAYKLLEGWFLIREGSALICYHTGRTGGHQISVAFYPPLEKGVIVISNGALGSNTLSLSVLRMLLRAKPVMERKKR